jgi:PadR family transcriptional regulator, regulatory protein PadR
MWESEIPVGRPPRHLYRLTAAGLELAHELSEKKMLATKAKRARLRPQTEGT